MLTLSVLYNSRVNISSLEIQRKFRFWRLQPLNGGNTPILYLDVPMYIRMIIVKVWLRNGLTIEQAIMTKIKDLGNLSSTDVLHGVNFNPVRLASINFFCKEYGVRLKRHKEEADIYRTLKGSSILDAFDLHD